MLSDKAIMAVNDIITHSELALGFVADMSLLDFMEDKKSYLAVVRCLEIISEASRRLPDDFKNKYPEILWQDISSAGNVYRHGYHMLDDDLVLSTVQMDLPSLLAVMLRARRENNQD